MFQKKEISYNGITLYAESRGDEHNPACILISGAMSSAHFWSNQFCEALVGAGYFVIRFDHRDSGLSSRVDSKLNPYSLKDLALDSIALINAYNIDKAHFIGHSMGGYICQQLALDFPDRVRTITIMSAGPLGATDDSEKPLIDDEKQTLQKTWDLFLNRKDGDTIEKTVDSFMRIWKHLNGNADFDEVRAREYTTDLLTRTKHRVTAGNNHELLMKKLYETMAERKNIVFAIRFPVLIIYGELDPLVLPRNGKALVNAIPNSIGKPICEMGHMFFSKDIENKIIKIIVEFLAQH